MKWRKILKEMTPFRTVGRFFRQRPWALCLLVLLLILYKYFFGWFTLLVTTSPIFLIAGVFLGIILAYGEPNNPEKDHVYKKIEKVPCPNTHDNSESVRGVPLPKIPSKERVTKHKKRDKKIRKRSHGVPSSSEPGSSESGGSDTDNIAMLHAFHHLRSGSNSSQSSQDGDSNDSSIEDGMENQHGNGGKVREGKHAKAVAWTADDQKNILKIGCLEIERNQRLETLIARRRARKYTDRNLIEFGSSDSLPTVEELSKFSVQLPAVFAPRKNPFDLPYNEDNFPESAPSAPLEMGNPFDLPSDQANESSSSGGANSSHAEPIPVASHLQRSALLRRHESFTEGAPFLSDFWQDARPSRFRPYFVTEKMANEEMTDSVLEGETSEKSNSKASSVQGSDSTSSVADQESQKDVLEDCSTQGPQSSLNQTEGHAHAARHVREVSLALDMEPPLLISDSSDDDISLSGEHTNNWEASQYSEDFSFSHNTLLEDPSVMQHHQEIDMISNGFHQMSPHSNDLELTSSSTDTTDDPFEVNDIELSAKEVVVIDDTHIPDPVYDSSPSGSERPAPIGLVIDEAVLQDGHAHTLGAEASIEEEGSPSRMEASSSEVAAPKLSSVEQSKLGEKEASEIREQSMVGHNEAHGSSVSHADPPVSDISSPPTTGGSTDG